MRWSRLTGRSGLWKKAKFLDVYFNNSRLKDKVSFCFSVSERRVGGQ